MPFALADVSHGGALRSGLAICAPGRSKHRSSPLSSTDPLGRLRNPPRKKPRSAKILIQSLSHVHLVPAMSKAAKGYERSRLALALRSPSAHMASLNVHIAGTTLY